MWCIQLASSAGSAGGCQHLLELADDSTVLDTSWRLAIIEVGISREHGLCSHIVITQIVITHLPWILWLVNWAVPSDQDIYSHNYPWPG